MSESVGPDIKWTLLSQLSSIKYSPIKPYMNEASADDICIMSGAKLEVDNCARVKMTLYLHKITNENV